MLQCLSIISVILLENFIFSNLLVFLSPTRHHHLEPIIIEYQLKSVQLSTHHQCHISIVTMSSPVLTPWSPKKNFHHSSWSHWWTGVFCQLSRWKINKLYRHIEWRRVIVTYYNLITVITIISPAQITNFTVAEK